MDKELLNKVTLIIKTMKDIDYILCPCCNKFEKCGGCEDFDCLMSTAIKARKMVE